MNETAQAVIQLKHVEQAAGTYVLRLRFADGKTVTVDFGPFLRQSGHPEIRKYLKPGLFKSYRLERGELMWGDFDLCFPIADLYEGRI